MEIWEQKNNYCAYEIQIAVDREEKHDKINDYGIRNQQRYHIQGVQLLTAKYSMGF